MIVSSAGAVAAAAVDVLARTTGVLMASSLALVSLSFLAAALVIRKLRLVAGVVMPSSSSFFLLFSNLCLIRLDCLLPNMMNVDVYYYYWDESVFVAMCHGLFDLPRLVPRWVITIICDHEEQRRRRVPAAGLLPYLKILVSHEYIST